MGISEFARDFDPAVAAMASNRCAGGALNHFRGPALAPGRRAGERRHGRASIAVDAAGVEWEWVMFSQVCAAACAAALVVGVFAPAESAARGGGAIGHAGGFHAGGGHPIVRPVPQAHAPFAHGPFAHARHMPFARFPGVVARVQALRAAALRHRGAIFGFGAYGFPVTYGDDGMFYGSYYDPSDVVGSVSVPAYADPPADPAPVAGREAEVVDRGGCRSETVAVPSPAGERSIIITRC
jgi:hypothetical protein